MLFSCTESYSSVSLFVYCASPAAPVMSHCQRLMPNQRMVFLHPPPPPPSPIFPQQPFSPSCFRPAWFLTQVITQRCHLQKTTVTKDSERKASVSGPSICKHTFTSNSWPHWIRYLKTEAVWKWFVFTEQLKPTETSEKLVMPRSLYYKKVCGLWRE